MLVSIPLSYLLSLVYNRYMLLALSMTMTLGFQSLLFPEISISCGGSSRSSTYWWCLPPGKYVGHMVIAESFLALIALQLRRFYVSYGSNYVDITGIFMMQLFNYIGLGYNYQNGGIDPVKLNEGQLQGRAVERPNDLTYMGYVNLMPACMVGPVYEYVDFDHYLNRTGNQKNISNSLQATLRELGTFLMAVLLFSATSFFPLSRITEPEFAEYNYAYKLLFVVLYITHLELKYLMAWTLGMMSMRASGFTYNPQDNVTGADGKVPEYNFARVEVNAMQKFYLDPSMKVKMDNWNISVQWALKRYIYKILYRPADHTDERRNKAAQASAQLSTVLVSALWHGLYLGYFISFVH